VQDALRRPQTSSLEIESLTSRQPGRSGLFTVPGEGRAVSRLRKDSHFNNAYHKFHTYRYSSSAAVPTDLPTLRVARLRAERTLTLVSESSSSGIFNAVPSSKPSRSFSIRVTMLLCFPWRPVGTSARAVVLNVRTFFSGMSFLSNRIANETLTNSFGNLLP